MVITYAYLPKVSQYSDSWINHMKSKLSWLLCLFSCPCFGAFPLVLQRIAFFLVCLSVCSYVSVHRYVHMSAGVHGDKGRLVTLEMEVYLVASHLL